MAESMAEQANVQLDAIDRRLLDAAQQGVPLVQHPYGALGDAAGINEAACIARLTSLRGERAVIRQISAIFDTAALGYASSLVAAKIAPRKLAAAAEVINAHPGVSHNYEREAEYNLWYTLAVPPDSKLGLQGTLDVLHRESGALATRALPTLRLYKIGVKFDLGGGSSGPAGSRGFTQADRTQSSRHPLNETDRAMIRVLQQDLPVEAEPFRAWAEQAGVTVEDLLRAGEGYLARKQMRRFAAVLHHRTAGMRANVMGVWVCDEEQCDPMGQKLASFREVSHCYRRPAYDDWPYRLYTMVHARDRAEAESTLQHMQDATGLTDCLALWSVREFKKQRVRYFTGETAQWEAARA
jgi:DNA-binding Lrp family transcriptional regulator